MFLSELNRPPFPSSTIIYRIAHDFFCFTGTGHKTARIASSKTEKLLFVLNENI